MISLIDFSIGFDRRVLLENVTTEFKAGVLTSLIGRNGTGKSTLLKAICGLNRNYSGNILIDGKNLRDLPTSSLSRLLAFVHTKRPQISNMSCEDIVALGRTPYTDWIGRLSEKDKKLVDEALNYVGMQTFANRKIDSLSDGEAQKIMIARAIAQDTEVIILDEPTSFLDLPTRFELAKLLQDLAHKDGKTVIFSTHELDIAIDMCDNIALIDNGKLINLSVKSMLESRHIERLFPVPSDYLARMVRR